MKNDVMVNEQKEKLQTALYIRLSREDGDKNESLSVVNQKLQLQEYIKQHSDELELYDIYVDDNYTGTNFERPAFQRMLSDIEKGVVNCVVVKDLSRLGRNMPKVTEYINDYFPSKKVRFIAINDLVDRQYYDVDNVDDMMIDIKNLFNGFYPKDISKKVRSTFRTKQHNGQFIGAFASYGYKKDPEDHNKLIIDEYAANIIRYIFHLFINGNGQLTIAKILNEEGIPCPSEYKKQCGMKYHNGNRHISTSYWTYATIHKILINEIYRGNMVQNKTFRQVCKKKAVSLSKDNWIIVEGTHEAIIDDITWTKTQNLLARKSRQLNLNQNIHMFAGFIRCGDCDRAMVKRKAKSGTMFRCGSYNRYGNSFCSPHDISEAELERIILDDLNLIIQSVKNTNQLIEIEQQKKKKDALSLIGSISKYKEEIEHIQKKKEHAYDDYAEDIISKDDYLRYKDKYEKQIHVLQSKIDMANEIVTNNSIVVNPWIQKLLNQKPLEHLDRQTIVEMVSMIYVYENNTIKIVYNFSDELDTLLNNINT